MVELPDPIYRREAKWDDILMGPVIPIPSKFTRWDKITINKPSTLEQIIFKIETDNKIKFTGVMIFCRLYEKDFMLYSSELSNGDSSILQYSLEKAFSKKKRA